MSNFTLELNEIIDYMGGTLINEFPTDVLTIEYLILSILDKKNSHANMLLDNCLTSQNIEGLRKIYVSVLEEHSKQQVLPKSVFFNDDLNKLLDLSANEADKMGDKNVGSEHVLLALLKEENNFTEKNVFEKFGLEYSFVEKKCNMKEKPSKKTKSYKKTTKQTPKPTNGIPLKSQVNTKAITSSTSEHIKQYTINLNKLAKEGKLDEIIGREEEIREIIRILSRRKKNNAVLVGQSGCGKTSIINGIANMIVNGEAPEVLSDKEILMLNPMALVSGTHFRGMFEERINGLFTELKKRGNYILFIDDIHTVLRNGNKEKDGDISGVINTILTDGTIKVIGTTTFKEYRNTIENNPSLAMRFQKVMVEPTTFDETVEIIKSSKKYYEEYHNVEYTDKAIVKTVTLAERYISDRTLPDSAFDIIDLAGANTSVVTKDTDDIKQLKKRIGEIESEKMCALNNGDFEKIDSLDAENNVLKADLADYRRKGRNIGKKEIVTETDIANVVSEITKIPVSSLNSDEKERIRNIDKVLKSEVIGQDESIDEICKIIKRNKVGLSDKSHNLGVFLLLGGSGTGKSLTAKTIAKEIYGSEKALIRIDMSEYSEKHSVSKLYGTSSGYIGYDDGGVLTNAIKNKPYSVVLLDEIEKADEAIYNVFLQVFDEGRLTEGNGNTIDCHNCIFIMTSNIGARSSSELGKGVGFTTNEDENKKNIITKELKRKFTPEFLNRIDKILFYNTLDDDKLKDIVKLELKRFNKRLNSIEYNIVVDDNVIDYIHTEAVKEKELGARPINRLIQSNIEDKITDLMLVNDYEPNYVFHATCPSGNEIEVS